MDHPCFYSKSSFWADVRGLRCFQPIDEYWQSLSFSFPVLPLSWPQAIKSAILGLSAEREWESGSPIKMHCLPVYSRTPSQTGWRGWEFVDSIRLLVSLCLSPLPHLSVRKIHNVHAHIFQEDTNQLFKNILASQVPSISSSAQHWDYCQAQMNIRRITSSLIASYTLHLLPSSDNAKRATI